KIDGKNHLSKKVEAHDFSREGLKLSINFDIKLGSNMEVNLQIPDKKLSVPVSGEIVWVKSVDNRLEAGLKIKNMNNELKSEILNWIFPQWLEKKRDQKTDKAVALRVSETKKS
ncbi:MAG: PilZ domain-containing protein, partial [Candidatus Aminicenantes bacterium]